METRRVKNRHRNMFLPLQNQMNDHMQMHDQKVREYQNYLNYLHFNIINNSQRNECHQTYNVPPPMPAMIPFPPMPSPATPVSLAFSHLSSPPPPTPMSPPASSLSPASSTSSSPTDFIEHNHQVLEDAFTNKIMEPMRNSYYGEEANVWGPGLLGLFVKSPSQFESLDKESRNSTEFDVKLSRKPKPRSLNITRDIQSQNYFSPKSEILPPGFEYNCSGDILLREETFNGNRSM